MRFTVVAPTRNRLSLLRDMVDSVRTQSVHDWELIVFDNGSTQDVRGFVASLADSRIRFDRSDEFLPVSESWNRAIDQARGDYVVLLGDDDGLCPDYFGRQMALIDRFPGADFLYSGFHQFVHPGVAPWEPTGYVDYVANAAFFQAEGPPRQLAREEQNAAVAGSLLLQRRFVFNMQAFLFRRSFLDSLRREGAVFHSPFPDYYLANVAMAKAETVIADAAPATVAGVSTASFGFTLLNDEESRGAAMLKSDLLADPHWARFAAAALPGPAYQTSYLVAMAHVEDALGAESPARIDVARYRRIQIRHFLDRQHSRLTWMRSEQGRALWGRLSWGERAWATAYSYLDRTYRLKPRTRPWPRLDRLRHDSQPHAGGGLAAVREYTGEFGTLRELLAALPPLSAEVGG